MEGERRLWWISSHYSRILLPGKLHWYFQGSSFWQHGKLWIIRDSLKLRVLSNLLVLTNFRSIITERWFHYHLIWKSWNGLKRHKRCCLTLRFLPELNSTIYTGSILRLRTAFGDPSYSNVLLKLLNVYFLFSVTNYIDLTILQLRKWGDTGHECTGLTVFSGDFCYAVVLETTFVFTDLVSEFLLFISPNISALMVMEQFRPHQLRLANSPSYIFQLFYYLS